MLGYFFLTAAEETVSPLARRAARGWEQSYGTGECFHPLREGWICPLACLS